MDERDWLAERFEEHRARLRAVAYRMLGSVSEADDAVQDAWPRISRADTGGVENLAGWLTTVVARALMFTRLAPFVRPALINGAAGVVVAAQGRPLSVMGFNVAGGRIVAIDVLSDPERLRTLDVSAVDD